MDGSQSKLLARELLDQVGIPNAAQCLEDYPHQFSGGMRQRVMIAMAISCNPKLLIADEPTTALDVTIQAQIIDLMKQLQGQLGMSIIWITHDLGVVARLTKRVIVMYAGYIFEEASVKELFANPRHPYTIGLLSSLPRIDKPCSTKLNTIGGQPPDLMDLPNGCTFAERCNYATEQCRSELPSLELLSDSHKVACWEKDRMERIYRSVERK
jgi:oligopeptide transport system ATP-binding protein